jgi:hypothetical protein
MICKSQAYLALVLPDTRGENFGFINAGAARSFGRSSRGRAAFFEMIRHSEPLNELIQSKPNV